MTAARSEGRIVKKLPLNQIAIHHLSRDRMVPDGAEMEAITASIKAHGQQTPIEVVPPTDGIFGMITGLRRFEALR